MQIVFVCLSTQFPTAKIKHSVSSMQPASVWLSVGMDVVETPVGNSVEIISVGLSVETVGRLVVGKEEGLPEVGLSVEIVGGLVGIEEGLSVVGLSVETVGRLVGKEEGLLVVGARVTGISTGDGVTGPLT